MPDFEFFVFTASEAFKADPLKVLQPARDLLISRKDSGLLSFHCGTNEVDGVSKGYFLLGWESIKRHQELIADKEAYEKTSKILSATFIPDSPLDMKHFTFEGTLEDVTSAPDTEFALFRLQEGKTFEDAEKPYSEILLPRLKRTKGWLGSSGFGPCIEEKGLYLLALGWESKELHEAAMKDADYMKDVHSLGAGVDLVSFVHVSLRKFL